MTTSTNQMRFDKLRHALRENKIWLEPPLTLSVTVNPSENEVALWLARSFPVIIWTGADWYVKGLSEEDFFVEELLLADYEIQSLVALILNDHLTAHYDLLFLKNVVELLKCYAIKA